MKKQENKILNDNQQNNVDSNINENQKMIKLYDLEMEEFKKIKTAPKDRWFNSIVAFMCAGICILLGVIIVCICIVWG